MAGYCGVFKDFLLRLEFQSIRFRKQNQFQLKGVKLSRYTVIIIIIWILNGNSSLIGDNVSESAKDPLILAMAC